MQHWGVWHRGLQFFHCGVQCFALHPEQELIVPAQSSFFIAIPPMGTDARHWWGRRPGVTDVRQAQIQLREFLLAAERYLPTDAAGRSPF